MIILKHVYLYYPKNFTKNSNYFSGCYNRGQSPLSYIITNFNIFSDFDEKYTTPESNFIQIIHYR